MDQPDSTPDILRKFKEIELVSYEKNRGKGYALRQGFKRAVEKGYDYAISIDSDGQHFAEDLPKFLQKLEEASFRCNYRCA
jgi:glycosyltransferase involved in cell wall biosynthesis